MPATGGEEPAAMPAAPEAGRGQESQESLGQATGQATERAERLRQQASFLAQQYIEQGDALLDQADLEGALAQYAQALEVDPENQPAREKMRTVQGLMGDSFAQVSEGIQDAIEREAVRRAQARLEAEQLTLD